MRTVAEDLNVKIGVKTLDFPFSQTLTLCKNKTECSRKKTVSESLVSLLSKKHVSEVKNLIFKIYACAILIWK
jgi:hypothetical protein